MFANASGFYLDIRQLESEPFCVREYGVDRGFGNLHLDNASALLADQMFAAVIVLPSRPTSIISIDDADTMNETNFL